jgi:hypothetical protein
MPALWANLRDNRSLKRLTFARINDALWVPDAFGQTDQR